MTREEATKPEDIGVPYSRCTYLIDLLIKGSLQQKPTKDANFVANQDVRSFHINKTPPCSNPNTRNIELEVILSVSPTIYVITCIVCKIQYAGETESPLNTRWRGHESNVKNLTDNPVSNHYKSYNHTIEDYMICAMNKERDMKKRLRLEEA